MYASSDSIDDNFDAATACVGSLAASGDVKDSNLLQFYGLYKQATEGKCDVPKPGIFDLKGRSKWAAWNALGDLSPDLAREQYVEMLTSLQPTWNVDMMEASKTRKGGGLGGPVFSSLANTASHDEEAMQDGVPPLIAAASQGDVDMVRQLLAEGASPNQRDADGCSPLHWAADRGHCAVISELLHIADIDLHAIDGDGLTPLHYAALAEQREAAAALLTAGADDLRKNNEGETAQDIAPPEWSSTFEKS